MKCIRCHEGEPRHGTTNIALELDGRVVMVRDVPGHVCPNCGESYLNEGVDDILEAFLDDLHDAEIRLMMRAANAA